VDDDAGVPRPPLAYRLSSGQWLAIDCAAAAVATAAVFLGFRHGIRFHTPSSVTAALDVAATAPVALRRIWPVPVLAVVTVGCCGLTALGRLLDGTDLSAMPDTALTRLRARSIGFVFQTFNLIPTLTAAENVEAALVPLGASGAGRPERAASALGSVGLGDRLHVKDGRLRT